MWEHPQLGKVEIGGWNFMYSFRNPPHALLEAEIAPQSDFALAFARLAPRIDWRAVEVTKLGEGSYHVLAVVENLGFLPTHVSKQALKMNAVRPVRVEVELPEGATLASGKARQEIGQLEGRSNKLGMSSAWAISQTDNRGKAEWVIRAEAGSTVKLTAKAERGGVIEREVTLE